MDDDYDNDYDGDGGGDGAAAIAPRPDPTAFAVGAAPAKPAAAEDAAPDADAAAAEEAAPPLELPEIAPGILQFSAIFASAPKPKPARRQMPVRRMPSSKGRRKHGQSARHGSAPARLLCLLRARLAALGSSALPVRGQHRRMPSSKGRGGCADTCDPVPPYCAYGLRVPASCVLHVPKARGSSARSPTDSTYRGTPTSLRRAARTAYRVPCGAPQAGGRRPVRAERREPDEEGAGRRGGGRRGQVLRG